MPKETYIPCLLQLFREHGYEGATLSRISQATGLGKASLYHHFPGGKDEMVATVLDFLSSWLAEKILVVLKSNHEASAKLQAMCDRLNELYEEGKQPCLLAILLMSSARELFHAEVKQLLVVWIEAIAEVLREAALDEVLARQRAEGAVIAIQGALILSQGLDNPVIFQRILRQLPQKLCSPVENVDDSI